MNRGRYLSWLVLPGFVLVTVVWLWPVVAGYWSSIPLSDAHFDPFLQSFLIGWDWKALTTYPSKLFHPPIFIPEPRTLTYMDHMTGEAILASPFLGGGWNSLAGAYNWLLLASFVLSAWATYRLTRLLGAPRVGAALSGAWFAFSSYRLAHLDLLNQLQTQFLPLGVFFLIRYMRRKKMRDAAGVVGALTAQVYFGWYYAYYLAIAIVAVGLYMAIVRGHVPPRKHSVLWLGLFLVGLLTILPVTWPYIVERRAVPEFGRSLGETVLYSADLTDYVRWHPHSTAATKLGAPSGGQPYWPGTFTVLLTAVWLVFRFRAPELSVGLIRTSWWRSMHARLNLLGDHGAMLFLSAVGFVMSLGPLLHVAGRLLWIPLPYALAYSILPGFSSMRAPGRLSVLVVLGLVVIAGHAWGCIRKRNGTLASWLAVLAIAFLFVESWIRPIPTASIPKLDRIPPVYSWVAKEPVGTPFLEIPVPREDNDETAIDSYRQLFVLAHGQPRLDGSSGFTSPRYRSFRIAMQDFPDDPSIDALERMGAKLVVVHLGDVPRERRDVLHRSIAAQKRLLPRARFGDVAVYEPIR